MEMEIWERGVLKRQKMTTPATTYSPRFLHTQTTLTMFLSNFAEWPEFKPSLYLFYVFHGKREKTPDRRLFAEGKNVCSNLLCGPAKVERTFIKTKSYSAFWEGLRAVGHSKRHRFLPNRTFFFSIHPYYACDTGLITTTSGLCLSKTVPTEIRH